MNLLERLFGNQAPIAEIDPDGMLAATNETQIIDVRERFEWNSGHIAGSTLIPLSTIGSRAGELDPGRPVIVVCRSGHRSARAVRELNRLGFSEVRSLRGGIGAWKRAGKPLVS